MQHNCVAFFAYVCYHIKVSKFKEVKMNYIILDMEWNQPLYSKMTVTEPIVLHAEVVQIGAVKMDAEFNVVDTFNVMIAPKYYKKMHKKVQKLTGITTEELQNGVPFTKAFEDFSEWCGEDHAILTWGPDDIPVLNDNLTLHSIDTSRIPQCYNLQIIFDAQITKEHRQVALGRALETLNEVGEDAHNALNDAKNTAIVCRHLDMVEGIKNYEELTVQFHTPNAAECDSSENTYQTKKEALKDRELTEFECPVCKKRAVCFGFVRQNSDKTLAIAQCETGKEFFVRFKFARQSDGRIRVKRAIYPMNAEYRDFYQQRKEINRSFNRAKRKKSHVAK